MMLIVIWMRMNGYWCNIYYIYNNIKKLFTNIKYDFQ